ncbi:MAG: HAD family hydrolase, partial [Alicyclobacillus sp.]|nr:HAD family hydrolase [Alicyclobacillus sp.]
MNGEAKPVRERNGRTGWLKQARVETILFDVDGVLLSEEGYFDASALTVWELLTSPSYLGMSVPGVPAYRPDPDKGTVRQIRSAVFDDDRVLDFMKQRGINANWDMVYLQFAAQLSALRQAAGEPELPAAWTVEGLRALGPQLDGAAVRFAAFPEWFAGCADKADMFARAAERLQGPDVHGLWEVGREAFQAWYLGDEHYAGPPSGKLGFLQQEEPLAPVETIRNLLSALRAAGFRLGIATGRPRLETYVPLRQLGWL